jgi:hypothetical protein
MHAIAVIIDDIEHGVIFAVTGVIIVTAISVWGRIRPVPIDQGARITRAINRADAQADAEYRKPMRRALGKILHAEIKIDSALERGEEPKYKWIAKLVLAHQEHATLQENRRREWHMTRKIIGSERGPRVEINKKKGEVEIKKGIRRG